MFTLCYSSIKGGVGKSSLTILTAKYISQVLKEKVILIDLDFQNSTSFHFVQKEDERNVANALFNNQITENIIQVSDYIGILQSSLKLTKMQTLHPGSLKNLLKVIQQDFQWCIIDTQPNYNNIVLNGLLAADLIITPVTLECFFDLKTALFLNEQLSLEYPEILTKWKLLFTRVRKALSEKSIVHEYEANFRKFFDNFLEIKIPDTKLIGKIIDTDGFLINNKANEKIYKVLQALCTEIKQYNQIVEGEI